ncbi:MAG: DegT/DnrJ/EryC1/StrS family aminotransferase [Desulfobulbaceae bacterium]|nr:DegT/DnrJ/EryC1/StrS family aminotransferase [Desulfobulbaceae bacterium]
MNIPLLDIKAQLDPLYNEIMAAIKETVDSTRYIMGPKIEAFEKNVASYSGTTDAIGVSSGTDALLASLMALGVGPGDQVLTTPYTFFATMGSILRLGAEPVFVDIESDSFNIDPKLVADILSEKKRAAKIKAIVPVHLFGQCCDMAPLLALAKQHNLPVIEDAAQAIGASYPMMVDGVLTWQRAGSMGDCGCFSFFPSKNLGGMGDGGMIVTSDSLLADQLRVIRVHGDILTYDHAVIGGNFRLDVIQAAVLDVKLHYLHKWHAARRSNAAHYNELFKQAGLVEKGLIVPPKAVYQEKAAENHEVDFHIYNQFVIRTHNRDALRNFLLEQGVGVAVYYPAPLHKQKCVSHLPLSKCSYAEADKAAAETLALPIYPELTASMREYVVDRITAFYKS